MDIKEDVKVGFGNFADRCKEMAGGTSKEQDEAVKEEKKNVPQLAEDKLKRIEAILKE